MEILHEVAYFVAVAAVGGVTGLSRAKFDRRKFTCRHAAAIAVLSAACAFGAVAVLFQPTLQRGRIDWLGLGVAAWIGVCGTDAYHWAQSTMRGLIDGYIMSKVQPRRGNPDDTGSDSSGVDSLGNEAKLEEGSGRGGEGANGNLDTLAERRDEVK